MRISTPLGLLGLSQIGALVLLLAPIWTAAEPAVPRSTERLERPPQGHLDPDSPIPLPTVACDDADLRVDLGADPWPGTWRSDGRALVLTPRSTLPAGPHRVRVFCDRTNTIEELANWGVTIGGDAVRRTRSFAFEATLDGGQRVAQSGRKDLPDRVQVSGSGRFTAGLTGKGYRLYASGSFVRNSFLDELTRNDERTLTDVTGTFDIRAEVGPLRLRAGDQAVRSALGESLVLGHFYRRGLSAALVGEESFALTAFALSTRPVVGSEASHGLIDERVEGGQYFQRLVDSPSSTLAVAAVYVTGDSTKNLGAGVSGDMTASSGDAWAIGLSSELFDRRFALLGEYAESRFDPDGDGDARRSDEAFILEAALRSFDAGSFDWEVELSRRQVGTFFHSLANPSLLADRDVLQGTSRLSWPRFEVDMELRREEDDVNGALSRSRADVKSLSFTYQGPQRDDNAWLALRYVSISGFESDEKTLGQVDDPWGGIDRLNRNVYLALVGGGWSLGYSRDHIEDLPAFEDLPPAVEVLTHESLNAGASYAKSRWGLYPSLQWSRLEDSRRIETTFLARLAARHELISDKLTLNLTADVFQVDLDHLLQDSLDSDDSVPSLSGELSWQVLGGGFGRPRLALWLRGIYTDDSEDGGMPLQSTASQLFLGAKISWLKSY